MIECPHCGELLPHGRVNCENCGAPVTAHDLSESTEQTQQLLAEAHAQRRRGEYDEAITLCTRVLRHDPENADALALLGDIYRELGNYREALGWYQLAVQHSPGRPAVQKRLDEMIERVFPGSAASAQRALPPAGRISQTPTRAREAVLRLLARLRPVHVVIAFAVLAMLGVLVVALASGGGHTSRPQPVPVAQEPNAQNTAVVMPPSNQPPVVTPPPDTVEATDEPPPITRPAVRPTPPTSNPATANPPVTTTQPVVPGSITPPATAATPAVPALTSEALEKQTEQLKIVLDGVAKTTKLQLTVSNVVVDPRTGAVRIDYTIPRMANTAETKKGLLYAGFQLIWSTLRVSTAPRTFTLRGAAYVSETRGVTTALLTDITWPQMEAARSATDYKTIQQYLTNPWWRDDLAQVAL